jgi:hypothetical protein
VFNFNGGVGTVSYNLEAFVVTEDVITGTGTGRNRANALRRGLEINAMNLRPGDVGSQRATQVNPIKVEYDLRSGMQPHLEPPNTTGEAMRISGSDWGNVQNASNNSDGSRFHLPANQRFTHCMTCANNGTTQGCECIIPTGATAYLFYVELKESAANPGAVSRITVPVDFPLLRYNFHDVGFPGNVNYINAATDILGVVARGGASSGSSPMVTPAGRNNRVRIAHFGANTPDNLTPNARTEVILSQGAPGDYIWEFAVILRPGRQIPNDSLRQWLGLCNCEFNNPPAGGVLEVTRFCRSCCPACDHTLPALPAPAGGLCGNPHA